MTCLTNASDCSGLCVWLFVHVVSLCRALDEELLATIRHCLDRRARHAGPLGKCVEGTRISRNGMRNKLYEVNYDGSSMISALVMQMDWHGISNIPEYSAPKLCH